MLTLSAKPRRRNAKDPAGKRCPTYLQWLRGRACILATTGECSGQIRACHWDEAGDKGMGTKVSDKWSLPMCDGHHAEQTDRLGWPKFQAKYRFSAREVCQFFWSKWPKRSEWEVRNG